MLRWKGSTKSSHDCIFETCGKRVAGAEREKVVGARGTERMWSCFTFPSQSQRSREMSQRGLTICCSWTEECSPSWVSGLAAFSHVTNRQTDMDTHTHTHTQVALLLRSVHPVGQKMSRRLNRIFKGLMSTEEFPLWQWKERRESRLRSKEEKRVFLYIKKGCHENQRCSY